MSDGKRIVLVATGTRAEFGLLRPVMDAIAAHPELDLRVAAGGAHLLAPALTIREVEAAFTVHARVPMQAPDESGRAADARAFGRGALGAAEIIPEIRPHVVVVLGDRLEAFAFASAASIGGVPLAHLHGGDRAEGVADEAMRHAISKLAHIHLPATEASAERLRGMGEDPDRITVVGSPAIDGLAAIPPLDDAAFADLGTPRIVVLMHAVGRSDTAEAADMRAVFEAVRSRGPAVVLHPNVDPGCEGVLAAIGAHAGEIPVHGHLPREVFLGLLRRADVLVGNSSAGMIEAAALPIRVVNIGRRQSGRERGPQVIDVPEATVDAIGAAVDAALASPLEAPVAGAFGDGRTGERVAATLAAADLSPGRLRKQNTF